MADLHTLLRDAAPTPLGPLDLASVRVRARRHSLRRILAWVAGLGAVVGVGAPVGGGVLLNAGSGERVEAVEYPAITTDTTVVVDASGSVRLDTDDATVSAGVGGAVGVESSAGGAEASGSTTTTGPAGAFPAARGCRIDNHGLLPGEKRTCRFTATVAGGWAYFEGGGAGDWNAGRVTVHRGDSSTTYRSVEGRGCGAAVIEPGDRVEVEWTQQQIGVAVLGYVAAGEGFDCDYPDP